MSEGRESERRHVHVPPQLHQLDCELPKVVLPESTGDVRLRRHIYSPETDGYCMIAAPTWTRQSRTCPPAGPASAAPPPLYKDCERMAFPGCVAEPASVGVCRSVRGATSPLVVNLHYLTRGKGWDARGKGR